MTRLVTYELRKLFDTRSTVVVMSVCLLLAAALGAVGLTVRPDGALDLSQMAAASVIPFAIVAPVLGVLAAASDWRTGVIQHTLFIEPRRERLFAAKAVAAVVATAGTSAIALGLAMLTGFALATVGHQSVTLGAVSHMSWGVASLVIPGCFLGFGAGSLLLSPALAITLVLVVEFVIDVSLALIPHGLGLYFASASFPNWLTSGTQPLAALSSFTLWIVVPMGLGVMRYLHKEAS